MLESVFFFVFCFFGFFLLFFCGNWLSIKRADCFTLCSICVLCLFLNNMLFGGLQSGIITFPLHIHVHIFCVCFYERWGGAGGGI